MKKILTKTVQYAIAALLVTAVIIALWETVRPTVTSWIPDNTVVYRAPEPEPSDYDMWLNSEQMRSQLELLYKKHQRDALTKEITDLESKP